MNIKIIVNPRAGGGKAKDIAYEVENFLCHRGLEYSLDKTFRPLGATTLAKKALEGGFDLIFSVGGDGTANEVANGLAGSRAKLAVIPAGKKNDFARSLGLDPFDVKGACETAISGTAKKIDLGLMNGRYFLNGIALGFKTDLAKDAADGAVRNRLLKKLSSASYFLRKFKPLRMVITADGSVIDSSVISVNISNGRYLYGGQLVAPKANLEDGLLDLMIVKNSGKIRHLVNYSRLKKGADSNIAGLVALKASKIGIECPFATAVKFDGEMILDRSSYMISVAPKKLYVMAN